MDKLTLSSTLIISSLILGACSSSGSSGTPPDDNNNNGNPSGGDTNQLGFVSVDDAADGSDISLVAAFVQFNTPIPANLISGSFVPELDICEVTDNTIPTEDDFDFPDIDGVDTSFTPISAGQSLVFTGTAGTFAELQQSTLLGFIVYTPTVQSLTGPLPALLSLDIPGDVFPAYSNVLIPVLGTLDILTPVAGTQLTSTTQFTWNTASIPNTYIEISVSSINTTNGTTSSVSCTVADDGEFSFPTATQSEMGSLFGFSAQRLINTVLQSGTSVLIVESSSNN